MTANKDKFKPANLKPYNYLTLNIFKELFFDFLVDTNDYFYYSQNIHPLRNITTALVPFSY